VSRRDRSTVSAVLNMSAQYHGALAGLKVKYWPMTELALPPIISQDELTTTYADAVVCDCRAYLDERDGSAAYASGHIPGARFIDLETVLSSAVVPGSGNGRHPLPTPEAFAEGLSRAGVGHDTPVVAYDDAGGMIAGRLVWMLRTLGQPAALLDGGIGAWEGMLEVIDPEIAVVLNEPRSWPADSVASSEEVGAHIADGGLVIDSRGPDRFAGEREPIDPIAGHIPGAINLPMLENLSDGSFVNLDALRRRFADAQVDDNTIYYCGSGVSACNNMLAAEAAGFGRGRLFVGSWSGWIDRANPAVATAGSDGAL